MRKTLSPLLAAAVLLSCGDGPGGIIINDTAVVAGIAYVDRDGDGNFSAADSPARGVLTALLLEATGDTVARATSRADGTFTLSRIAAGRYRLVAARGAAGDTVEVLQVDSAQISVAAGDSIARFVRLGYPRVTIAVAKQLPSGRRITLEGIALNGWSTFGDSTLHIADPTGWVRAVRVAPSSAGVQAGDSITLLATVGALNGQFVLADGVARVLVAARGLPPADSIATLQLGTADNGRVAEGHVRVAGAVVRDTGSVGNYRRLGVDDGSGRGEVLLLRSIPFPSEAYLPGATVNFTGVMTPSPTGTWQLRPRLASDAVGAFPRVSTAMARSMPIGSRVYVNGIALNNWNTFGDSTVHVADATGAIRAVRVPPVNVTAGDSVEVLGILGMHDTRIALVGATIVVVDPGRGLPPVDSVSTASAATAAGGARADNQVRIGNALIIDTATVAGERVLGVNDGSGRLDVALDPSVPIGPGPWVPGGRFSGRGLLVGSPTGSSWRLKPRNANEATVVFTTVTTVQARTTAQGQQVVLQGLALNAWPTFGDSTVHIMDAAGALRAVRVVGNVAAGDSIRVVGTVGTRNGQPVVTNASASVLLAGVGLPAPDSISTGAAASAAGGARDAGQVKVAGLITGSQVLSNGLRRVDINDGSGLLEVVVSQNFPGQFTPGAILNAAGVLIPTGTGTWQLRPRTTAEVNGEFQTKTIAQARALTAGSRVYVHGIALNSWITFGDASVHLRDATGSIRVITLPQAQIIAGDSIRVLGEVRASLGQPVLDGLSSEVLLGAVGAFVRDSVSTFTAARAANGTLDAGLVAVSGTVSGVSPSPPTPGADVLLTISDGSGDLIVRLDADAGFATGSYVVGDILRVRGVLVPNSDGTAWELKPRAADDIVKGN